MKQKVIVIGSSYTSRLCIIRSLGKLGYDIGVVIDQTNSKPIDCYSKYVKNIYYCQGKDKNKLIQILINSCVDKRQKVILIPISDFAVSTIDQNRQLLDKYFMFPHINRNYSSVTKWMNKDVQKNLARRVGLNVVDSINVDINNRSFHFPTDVHYPCFTKINSYLPGCKHTLHHCTNEQQLIDVLNNLCKVYDNMTLMIEDYKVIEKEYAVVGFTDGREVVIPGIIEILSMAKGRFKGVANQGKIIPIRGFEDLIEKYKSFVYEIGFVGMFDIDFYLSGGTFYFSELNLRLGGSGYAMIKKGVNLPEMFVRTLLGKSIVGMKKEITESATYVNERISCGNWCDGLLSDKLFFNQLYSSDIRFVKDKRDFIPGVIFNLKVCKMFVIKIINTCLKKKK